MATAFPHDYFLFDIGTSECNLSILLQNLPFCPSRLIQLVLAKNII